MESSWRWNTADQGLWAQSEPLMARVLVGGVPANYGIWSRRVRPDLRAYYIIEWLGYKAYDFPFLSSEFFTSTHFPHGFTVQPDVT